MQPSWLMELGGLTNLSAVGLLALVFLAVVRGWLVPRSTIDAERRVAAERLEDVRADRDARVAEALTREGREREVAQANAAAMTLLTQANANLVQAAETTESVIAALRATVTAAAPQRAPEET